MASEHGGARCIRRLVCANLYVRALAMGTGLLDMRRNTLGLTDASKLRIKFS